MQKPEESLDDFTVRAMDIEKTPGPPAVVFLRFRGDVEVLKPLAARERLANPGPAAGKALVSTSPYRLSWFQSFLAAGGALAVMVLILLSAVLIGIYDPPPGPDVASVDTVGSPGDEEIVVPEEAATQTEEPLSSESITAQSSPPADDAVHPLRAITKPSPATRSTQRAAYKPRRVSRRPVVPRFVPTTLVIYAENGEIKTRIEPRHTAFYN
jgi:hypothetical protein